MRLFEFKVGPDSYVINLDMMIAYEHSTSPQTGEEKILIALGGEDSATLYDKNDIKRFLSIVNQYFVTP